jgi:1-acyl-sn-glycerol-3-phosphate acyltransferase
MFVGTRFHDPAPAALTASAAAPAQGLADRLRERRPGSSLARVLFYEIGRWFTLLLLTVIYRYRVYGSRRIPRRGPLLVIANHQSYFDPPVIGASIRGRQLDYLARSATFNFKPLALVITALNAIPLKEDTSDVGAMKTVLARLAEGGAVLVFPEGGRTSDGRMDPLKRGIALLMKRARCAVLPIAIEGCHDSWPKGQLLPNLIGKRIEVAVGHAMTYEEAQRLGPEKALERLGDEIDGMRLALRRRLRRETAGRYPSRGAGDLPRRT